MFKYKYFSCSKIETFQTAQKKHSKYEFKNDKISLKKYCQLACK